MEKWYEKYLGIPFKAGGRDFDGCDCGGLFLLVLKTEKNIIMQDYNGLFTRNELRTRSGLIQLQTIIEQWLSDLIEVPIDSVRPYDGLIYNYKGANCHVGTVVNEKYMLHLETNHHAHLEPINLQGYKLVKAYRHEKTQETQ